MAAQLACVRVSVSFYVLDLVPDLTRSGTRKDTTGCEDRRGFPLCSLACVLVFRALVTSPTTHVNPVTAKPPSQEGDYVRNVTDRGPLVASCLPAHEQKPGGLCSQRAGSKTCSGKGPSLCHRSASRKPGWLSSSRHDLF